MPVILAFVLVTAWGRISFIVSCSICDGLDVGDTRRRVSYRFVAKAIKALRPWDANFRREHREVMSATMNTLFTPFVNVRILGREA